MKIIDLGICIDNNDPKGVGRIRVQRYSDYVSGKENMIPNGFVEWDDKDPFVAIPFLPSNINFIPEIKQVVKVLNYNPDKETVNQEYIAGPFTTMFDFNSQTFSQQVEDTSYGIPMKEKPQIIGENQTYKNPRTKNSFAKYRDYAIYGKYGSDTIFTENGIILRGGKLISKEFASKQDRQALTTQLLMAEKCAKLQLKKFGVTLYNSEEEKINDETDVSNLNFILEYNVDNINDPKIIEFYLYKTIVDKTIIYRTNFFDEYTNKVYGTYKLINNDDSETKPTYIVDLTKDYDDYSSLTLNSKIKLISSIIRTKILQLRIKGITAFDESLEDKIFPNFSISFKDIHPFYYRPFKTLLELKPSSETELSNKLSLLRNIKITTDGTSQSGLIWSANSIKPPVKRTKTIDRILKTRSDSEQTFSSLVSDKIYFLSSSPNPANRVVNFNSLDTYEYTQDDYISKIEPNTYSLVRGENLLAFLTALMDVVEKHEHNLIGPMVKRGFQPYEKLNELFKSIENDILNTQIRIN